MNRVGSSEATVDEINAVPIVTTIPNDGSPWLHVGGEIVVNSTTNGAQDKPQVVTLSNGNFVIAWRDDLGDLNGSGIKAQLFNAGGAKLGGEIRVNTAVEG